MVRPVTSHVYECLMLDVWPRPSGVVDFCIDSPRHFGALQHAIRHDEVTPEQLDAALGNPEALQALVREDNPYFGVVFR